MSCYLYLVMLIFTCVSLNVHVSTDPPGPNKDPAKQSSGKKKEIITKHDSTVCGRRNVKIMEKVPCVFF